MRSYRKYSNMVNDEGADYEYAYLGNAYGDVCKFTKGQDCNYPNPSGGPIVIRNTNGHVVTYNDPVIISGQGNENL